MVLGTPPGVVARPCVCTRFDWLWCEPRWRRVGSIRPGDAFSAWVGSGMRSSLSNHAGKEFPTTKEQQQQHEQLVPNADTIIIIIIIVLFLL